MIDFILNIDKHLIELVAQYGRWVYAVLFAIVFAETGLVVTPILPGDSLLFAAGALCGVGALNAWVVIPLLIAAAFIGDAVNYSIGRSIGPRVFSAEAGDTMLHRLLNREHLQKAHEFFEKHGGKAIVLCRFAPIVRTFVPFVAGAGQMPYSSFVFYNLAGGVAGVVSCVGAGILFGNVPVVKENFSLVTIGIVLVSLMPMAIEWIRHRRRRLDAR